MGAWHPTTQGKVTIPILTFLPPEMTVGALCATHHDPNLWFSNNAADQAEAKQICGVCPIKVTCLAGAITRRERTGCWGGVLFTPRWIPWTRRRCAVCARRFVAQRSAQIYCRRKCRDFAWGRYRTAVQQATWRKYRKAPRRAAA